MTRPEPQPRMPVAKKIVCFGLLVVAILLLVCLYLANAFNAVATSSTLAGVITSMLIVSSVELLPEFCRWLGEYLQRGRFLQFFGDMVIKDDVRLVFSYRDLNESGKTTDPFKTYYKPPMEGERVPLPEGINGWLAFQDVQAAVYVANLIAKMTGRQVRATHDRFLVTDPKHFCIVSFGLGFNQFTHDMAGYFEPHIFNVQTGKSPKDGSYTDNLTINGEFPEIPDNSDIAIVARIVPPPEAEQPTRVWFVCAGRTAAGTAAAGYFLAKKWEKIHELYRMNKKDLFKDSVVALIHHREFKAGESGGNYDHTASLAYRDSKAVCAWGVAVGVE